MNISLGKKQKGAETLEFVVIFGMFMMLIMTVFDFARALYVWNALTEATRRGARMAVVCPSDQVSQNAVKQAAVFDVIGGTLGTSPVVKGLAPAAITITYYDDTGAVLAGWNPNNDEAVQFAEVSINNNYQFQSIIPYVNIASFAAPSFRTTLFSESKGLVPVYPGDPAINPQCSF